MRNKILLAAALLTGTYLPANTLDLSNIKSKIEIIGGVNMGIVSEAQKLLSLPADTKEVAILVNSPGGSVDAGQLFIQAIKQLRSRGVKVICVSGVLAASMGFQILAHCSTINVLPSTLLLFHPVRISGQAGFTADMLDYYSTQIKLIEAEMVKDLRARFKFSDSYFSLHFQMETLHSATELAKKTNQIRIYTDIKGFDRSLYTFRRPSIFDLFRGNKGIQYTMPDDMLKLLGY